MDSPYSVCKLQLKIVSATCVQLTPTHAHVLISKVRNICRTSQDLKPHHMFHCNSYLLILNYTNLYSVKLDMKVASLWIVPSD